MLALHRFIFFSSLQKLNLNALIIKQLPPMKKRHSIHPRVFQTYFRKAWDFIFVVFATISTADSHFHFQCWFSLKLAP